MSPPGVFNSWICPQWYCSNSSIIVQVFLPPHWFPWRFLFRGFCSGKLWFSILWMCVSVSSVLGTGVCLWPHFSDRSKNSCWFFILFGFLLVRTEWWLPSSWSEMGSLHALITWFFKFTIHYEYIWYQLTIFLKVWCIFHCADIP